MDRNDALLPESSQPFQFDFPAFIDRLLTGLALTAGDSGPRPAEQLALLGQLVEQLLQDCQPLTERMRREADEMRRHLATIDALVRGTVVPSGPASLFHPVVHTLLWMNYQHVVETSGRDAANGELRAIVKNLTRKPKGRPATFSLAVIQQMKALHDEGHSYGRIARKLGISPQVVRTTLAHHFPPESTQKKPGG